MRTPILIKYFKCNNNYYYLRINSNIDILKAYIEKGFRSNAYIKLLTVNISELFKKTSSLAGNYLLSMVACFDQFIDSCYLVFDINI